jgi:hypothetical protein
VLFRIGTDPDLSAGDQRHALGAGWRDHWRGCGVHGDWNRWFERQRRRGGALVRARGWLAAFRRVERPATQNEERGSKGQITPRLSCGNPSFSHESVARF